MKELSDTMKELGFMFGIHDQYRDFYKKAKSYSDDLACMSPDGSIYTHKRWAGGPQSYLCTTQAPYYVKRNFTEIAKHNIHLDCAYLDVFTCNEGDDCANPHHRMTRCDSYRYRNKCFDYLLSKNILPSSEEVNDWAIKSLVFCHYAPYDFMLENNFSRKSLIISLGGGVICDMGGYISATYMRGIEFIQVPTSLLAQVDASVGGKVAINHPKCKNMIGSFKNPYRGSSFSPLTSDFCICGKVVPNLREQNPAISSSVPGA